MNSRSRRRLLRVLVALVIVGLAGYGWLHRHNFVPVAAGSLAPDYSARTLDGATVTLSDYRGKVVLLNAWATWCRPCVVEMPSLERAYRALKSQGLEIVAVSVDAPLGGFDSAGNQGGDIKAFAEQQGLTFTILHDPKGRIKPTFDLFGLPTTVVIDRSGRIVRKSLGIEAWDDEQHMRELRDLLAGS
jgi:peroxiredoxin